MEGRVCFKLHYRKIGVLHSQAQNLQGAAFLSVKSCSALFVIWTYLCPGHWLLPVTSLPLEDRSEAGSWIPPAAHSLASVVICQNMDFRTQLWDTLCRWGAWLVRGDPYLPPYMMYLQRQIRHSTPPSMCPFLSIWIPRTHRIHETCASCLFTHLFIHSFNWYPWTAQVFQQLQWLMPQSVPKWLR